MATTLLTVKQAAENLSLSVGTVRAWILHRKIEYIKLNGGAIRIPSTAIEQIVSAGTVPAQEVRR